MGFAIVGHGLGLLDAAPQPMGLAVAAFAALASGFAFVVRVKLADGFASVAC